MPAFDQLTLTTKRLLLRPLRHSDACELLGIFSDPKVMRYWSAPPWESIKQAKSMIDRDIKAMAARERAIWPRTNRGRYADRHMHAIRHIGAMQTRRGVHWRRTLGVRPTWTKPYERS